MTYQNIMIDRIKEMIDHIDCDECPHTNYCNPGNLICTELKEWLNEQYI